ncbi:ABC transporter permease [Fulvimarina sp. 2208YS6-2-32]|uniref:ABC transporter permease n=1 Tax=Fulvimarina uroteuthidis TaxID=3098149 RepID=A0ABU5I554_9HYPH|nr:ABC transporter permease [Fulvimarina sp. 2208YS6-2-32]MDY8110230.1 ABC transporter permease [Fulvimarina sp. 2208YS6-2-32]
MIGSIGKTLRRLAPQLVALIVILGLNAAISPGFLDISYQNGRLYGSLIDILNRGAPVALLAIGMTLVIATKGIDLSVGAVMAITGAVAAAMITSGSGPAAAILAAIGVGILCGLWNGALVSLLSIQPIIATLILMVAGRGIAQLITEGIILTFNDPGLIFFGSGHIVGVPMPVILWITLGAAVAMLVRMTALGMLIEAVGVNRKASMLAGVGTVFLLFTVYAASGLCAAVAGVIAAADIRGADANNAGLWLELDAILAVVIGGTSLLGGRFSILGSLIGAMVIQSVNTGILLAGFKPEFNLIIKAAIIVVILIVQSPRAHVFLGFLARQRRSDRRAGPTLQGSASTKERAAP